MENMWCSPENLRIQSKGEDKGDQRKQKPKSISLTNVKARTSKLRDGKPTFTIILYAAEGEA